MNEQYCCLDCAIVQDAAWYALIETGIGFLPVSLSKVAYHLGIQLRPYSAPLDDASFGYSSWAGGQWIIHFNANEPSHGRVRFTIAHELGHILLGHMVPGQAFAPHPGAGDFEPSEEPSYEQAANVFAVRLLAPACVLWGLNITSVEEIQETCQISCRAAECRSERMQIIDNQHSFLMAPLERQLYHQFEPFIQEHRK